MWNNIFFKNASAENKGIKMAYERHHSWICIYSIAPQEGLDESKEVDFLTSLKYQREIFHILFISVYNKCSDVQIFSSTHFLFVNKLKFELFQVLVYSAQCSSYNQKLVPKQTVTLFCVLLTLSNPPCPHSSEHLHGKVLHWKLPMHGIRQRQSPNTPEWWCPDACTPPEGHERRNPQRPAHREGWESQI